jgi:hypothetical protein
VAAPIIVVCGSGARAAALARALAPCARVETVPLPGARLSTAAAEAASARRIDQAWRALGAVDAVVILVNLSIAPRRRNPSLAAWRTGIAATLRAGYAAARVAGLALARQGRGTLLIVNENGAGGAADAVAAVASEGLSCLGAALPRALGGAVRVAEIWSGSRRGHERTLARGILTALGGAPDGSVPRARFSAGSQG